MSLGTNDYDRAKAFYARVLKVIGCKLIMEHPALPPSERPIRNSGSTTPSTASRPLPERIHVGFAAQSKAEVDMFFKEAIAAGATADGDPGHRHDYGEPYYGCFVRDPDGNKIEATYWDMELARKLGMG